MIAALFVETGGAYFGLEGVDPWDSKRDARLYAGPHPVVAHPPCSRWCRLAGLVQARWGHKKGDDGGCFASALASVRAFGGVLEHPAWSEAFVAHGLGEPSPGSGWQSTLDGGAVTHLEQWHYGHRAKKATWLYAFGIAELPAMRWGFTPDNDVTAYVTDGGGDVKRRAAHPVRLRDSAKRERARQGALISWCGNNVSAFEDRPRLGKKEACATPTAFRDALIDIARRARISPAPA